MVKELLITFQLHDLNLLWRELDFARELGQLVFSNARIDEIM